MTIRWGISANSHDAALAVIADEELIFASHSERYSKIKNDPNLNEAIINAALRYGQPNDLYFYETPKLKRARQLYAGQKPDEGNPALDLLRHCGINAPIIYTEHHRSHAAAGYFTSGFADATVIVVDAIGEWETLSVWNGQGPKLKKLYSESYPHSLGLFYSAFTDLVGLKANEEEYIFMGMAAFGQPTLKDRIKQDFIASNWRRFVHLKQNLHRGCRYWEYIGEKVDIAASVQEITEDILLRISEWAYKKGKSKNLVLMGGVALNCVANSRIAQQGLWEKIWIMPSPGDAGSSLGAILAHTNQHIIWPGPYLGHEIKRDFDIFELLHDLQAGKIVGIANGRAEFGPRALGNRSLLADPRIPDIKDKMNVVKKREKFRPFAPAILASWANDVFEMPLAESPYMQYVAKCKEPERYPGIVHIDGTSRVQTVTAQNNPFFHRLLTFWYTTTGCPMLLNTSLNIKGQPLVNDLQDVEAFTKAYGVKVF
jgi:carbamoyltransferase